MGPYHRQRLPSPCQTTPFDDLETPLGPLAVAQCPEIFDSKFYSVTSSSTDIGEHSLEVQFPFIKYFFPNVEILPILVSDIGNRLDKISSVLTDIVNEDSTALVISSDFCHWGTSYNYSPSLGQYGKGAMWERIKALDQGALDAITSNDPTAFKQYLDDTANTICGREPILIAMDILKKTSPQGTWRWLHYSQSSQVMDASSKESSVSYVAGAFCLG